jgi:linoleoyl-CoA desaturase
MKATKFSCTNELHQQFGVTVKKNVHNYFKENNISTKGNAGLVVKTVVLLSMYIVPFVWMMSIHMNPWLALALTQVMGVGMAGIGMCVMHDSVHGSYSSKEWVNKWLGRTIYLLGNNVFNWKIQHNVLHHTYTNIEGHDEDIADKGPLRLSNHVGIRKIHYYQYIHAFFFYGLMTFSKLVKEFGQLKRYSKMGYAKKFNINLTREYTKLVFIKVAYLFTFLVFPLFVTDFTWWQLLIGFLSMNYTAGFIMSVIFQLAHVVEGIHDHAPTSEGIVENNWAVHELLTTANFAPHNHLLNWYIGGLNYQIEHHLFPGICHVHYRDISPIVARTAKEFGIPYHQQPTFRKALASHVRKLKELSREQIKNVHAEDRFVHQPLEVLS